MNMLKTAAAVAACVLAFSAQAALFEDDEARRAVLDLRQKVDASQQRISNRLAIWTQSVRQKWSCPLQ